jgi:hypothetical protein
MDLNSRRPRVRGIGSYPDDDSTVRPIKPDRREQREG